MKIEFDYECRKFEIGQGIRKMDCKDYNGAFRTDSVKNEPPVFDILTECKEQDEKFDIRKLDPEDICYSKSSENVSPNNWNTAQIKIEENIDIFYEDIKSETDGEKSSESFRCKVCHQSFSKETNFFGCTSYGLKCRCHKQNEDKDIDVKLFSGLSTDSGLQPIGVQCESISGDEVTKVEDPSAIFQKIPVPPMENDCKMKHQFSSMPVRVCEKIRTVEKPVLGKICSKTLGHNSTLKVHERTHTGEKPVQCKNCSKSFNQSSDMKRHERIHTGEKPFHCKVCLKSFTQGNALKRHERIHTGDKPFHCKICSKSFGRSSVLKDHERIHTGEKPFDCKVCFKSFSSERYLKVHETIHTGEKRFHCKICSKSFSNGCYFKVHEMIHTGEKRFHCKVCSKSFTHKNALKVHEIIHTRENPFHCKICSKSFVCEDNLKAHKKIHTGKKSFQCNVCLKSFSRGDRLRNHESIHTVSL